MSKLSRKRRIKRKHQKRKERDKQVHIRVIPIVPVVDPNVEIKNGLRVATFLMKGMEHKPIKIGGFTYQSAADFSVDKGWIQYWGSRFEITCDIHGNYFVYWKRRFPLFDSIDYELDERHHRIMMLCSSKEDAEKKMAFIQSHKSLSVLGFEDNLYYLRDHYPKKEFRQLLPFVFYEDTVLAFTVEDPVEEKFNS